MPSKIETSATITAWAEKTFGRATVTALSYKLMEEVGELDGAINKFLLERDYLTKHAEETHKVAMECADVAIMLHQLCRMMGYDLDTTVDEKMAVNRAREWDVRGDGTGQHINVEV